MNRFPATGKIVPGCFVLALGLTVAGCSKVETVRAASAAHTALPRYDHVVVVMEENHSFSEILDSPVSGSYFQELASGGACFTRSFAVTHPSQPNYLAIFSGSTCGIADDALAAGTPFVTPNLGAALRSKGLTFTGYAESLPAAGFLGGEYTTDPRQHQYVRKHTPWTNWQADAPGPNQLPPAVNLPLGRPFSGGPDGDFSKLPTVAIVVPNEQNDMHDGSTAAADTWLRDHLSAYAKWAKTHNSLLIVTWDEDRGTVVNQIPTIFYGAHIRSGRYPEYISHYRVLRTIEDFYGLPPAGKSAGFDPISDVFGDP